ncbi:hypothetical protein L5515_015715 [Caenorhabditis briggsae]|uniref:Uncharacterized protein n=1 Tax=Caenorhabditis briggsae TaxID=6238 RepID=A0AAE9EFN7_CAEBR|nr:hypothetical protein L5515_015715 [Caenorhabditis briggsae]
MNEIDGHENHLATKLDTTTASPSPWLPIVFPSTNTKPQSSQSQEPKLKRASRDLPTPIVSLVGASVAFMLIIFVGAFFYCRH